MRLLFKIRKVSGISDGGWHGSEHNEKAFEKGDFPDLMIPMAWSISSDAAFSRGVNILHIAA